MEKKTLLYLKQKLYDRYSIYYKENYSQYINKKFPHSEKVI
jgi:hypothetical protein